MIIAVRAQCPRKEDDNDDHNGYAGILRDATSIEYVQDVESSRPGCIVKRCFFGNKCAAVREAMSWCPDQEVGK